MVKTPNVRHSKSRKDPVTINLEASPVTPERPTDAGASAAVALEDGTVSNVSGEGAGAEPEDEPGKDKAAAASSNKDPLGSDDLTASNESLLSDTTGEPLSAPAPERKALEDDRRAETEKSPGFGRDAAGIRSASTSSPDSSAPRRAGPSALAAGLIGGALALIGAGALQYSGVLPFPSAATDPAAIERMEADMTRLQSELAAVQSNGDAGASEAVSSLQSRIDQLAADVGSLQQAVEAGGAGENAGLAALDTKIADLEVRIAQIGQNGGAQTIDLSPLEERIATLETELQTRTQTTAEIDARLARIEEIVSGLDGRVAELARKVEAQGDQPKIALSIAASALKAAIDRGQPFAAELETIGAISPNLPQFDALRAHAEAGVATREDLIEQVDQAAGAMIAAGKPVDENAGYLDQLWNSAASLVTVRPVGAIEGEGVPETVARMEAALKEGDLAKVLAEYDSLPQAAKDAGAHFAARVRARLEVETLAEQAIAEAMKTV